MAKALKGLARGLTADLVGGPVDLATTLANLGVAAFGFGGHKLGLLDQPPELIDPKTVPFSSDWLAKGTPLEDDGSAQYTAGRMGAAVLPAAWSAAGKVKPQPKGQVNALFPGGSDDYLLQHATNDTEANDFYHLSSALQKRLSNDFGDVIYAMNPKKLDPKSAPSVIVNRDFYSPRRGTSWAGGAVDGYDLKVLKRDFDKNDYVKWLQKRARHQLADRFEPQFPFSGKFGEGGDLLGRDELKKFGPAEPPIDFDKGDIAGSYFSDIVEQSPRFQSFKHWEKSPSGAGTLNRRDALGVDPRQFSDKVFQVYAPQLEAIRAQRGDPEFTSAAQWVPYAKKLAKENNPVAIGFLHETRNMPSEYGEVKTWGRVPLNKETVGGALFPENGEYLVLRQALKKKGIPFETYTSGASSADPFSLRGAETRQQFLDFQNSVQRRTRD